MKGIEVEKRYAKKVLDFVKNRFIDTKRKIIKEEKVLKIPKDYPLR